MLRDGAYADPPTRVLALARVSSEGQADHGTSLASQQDSLAAYARSVGAPSPTLFVEVESGGESAQERRVEVERLIATARPGDVVVVTKTDRWSRNLPWAVASVRALIKRGVGWRSVSEGIDAGTPQGDFLLGIMAAVANQELARIRERTVGGRQRLRRQGLHVEGLPPLGYRVVDRRLVPDEERRIIALKHFTYYVDGMSLREVVARIAAEHPGTPGLDTTSAMRRLHDRRYIGESCSEGSRKQKRPPVGEWRPTHEAIVDTQTFYRVQAALAERRLGGRPPASESRTAGYLLRGLMTCGACGGQMSAHSPTNGAPGYYVCTQRTSPRRRKEGRCNGPILRQDAADKQLAAMAFARLAELAHVLARPTERRTHNKAHDFDDERMRIIKRRERVAEAIADGTLTREAARTTLERIEHQLADVERRRAAHSPAPTVDRNAVLGQVETLRAAWEGLTIAERREAIGYLAERITAHSTATRKWQRGEWRLEVAWHAFE